MEYEIVKVLLKRKSEPKVGSISKVGSKEKNNFLCALNYIDE